MNSASILNAMKISKSQAAGVDCNDIGYRVVILICSVIIS